MTKRKNIATAVASLIASGVCLAAEPALPMDECIESAATYHSVNAKTLKAIIFQESSGRSGIVTRNTNNSRDIGPAGINSVHLPELAKYGITEKALMDSCVNVYVGAWKYSKKVARHGNSWRAVGAYHSETPQYRDAYIKRIQAHLANWGVLPSDDMRTSAIKTEGTVQ